MKNKLEQLNHNVKIIHSENDIEVSDVMFILSYSKILKKKHLEFSKHNIVVHESDLPKGRGMSPLSWQILEGVVNIPICLFQAVEELDDGDIYIKDFIKLNGYELIDELRDKLGTQTIKMCLEFVVRNPDIMVSSGIKQVGEKSYYKRRTPKDSELDINQTIKQQFNHLRIVDNNNYPAFFIVDGKKYIVKIELSTTTTEPKT